MKRIQKTMLTAGMIFSVFLSSCSREHYPVGRTENVPNDIVLQWNEIAYEAFGGVSYQHSLMAARINAMVHIAMHDAINAVTPKYEAYTFTGKNANADVISAAASAAHTILLHEIPAKKGFLDSALQQTLANVHEGAAKTEGVSLGREAAHALLSYREDDGSAGNPVMPVKPAVAAGSYQAVPPFDFLFAPYWENVKLFGLKSKDQFRCTPPPGLTSEVYTASFNEVRNLGKKNSSARTADQTSYASFWYEFSEAGWNRIARTVAASKMLDIFETARLLALVDMAMADAYTAGWDSKLYYNLWRPYTAIRNAENDGNSQTSPDKEWEPHQVTPPIQDYPSTHSALGNAAAVVMATILGDETSFTFASTTAPAKGGTRSFASFSEAAKENADSRVMAGLHFRFACDAGMLLGANIANYVISNHLKPIK